MSPVEAEPLIAGDLARYQRLITAQAERRFVTGGQKSLKMWRPLAHQKPPPTDEDWDLWLLLGGRGCGKTDACAHWIDKHATGAPCLPGPVPHRINIVAPTLGDASEACVEGPSGLRSHNPAITVATRRGSSFVMWPNGSQARLLGTNSRRDVDRLRAAGNSCAAWIEEFAAWPYIATGYTHLVLGLRQGHRPHIVGSTTPKARALLLKLVEDPKVRVVYATTDDNPFLEPERRARYHELYDGTMIGRQELGGELITDVAGALWTTELIDANRVMNVRQLPPMERVVVAVDPSWGTTRDECGIIVAGLGTDGHGYVISDLSGRMTPSEWGEVAGKVYRDGVPMVFPHRLDRVLAEKNFQGEQVRLVMRVTAEQLEMPIPFGWCHASVGKRLRAEPIQALDQQGRIHHVGVLSGLEAQMTTWVPPRDREVEQESADAAERELARSLVEEEGGGQAASEWSPDRIDARVFALTHLMLETGGPSVVELAEGRVPSTRPRSVDLDAGALPPALRRLHEMSSRRSPIGNGHR